MVEDRVLEEIKLKARNLLKHYPCRKLRLLEVTELVSDPAVGFAIKVVAKGPDWNYSNISLFNKKDLKDPTLAKRCVEKLLKNIPAKFSRVVVTEASSASKEIMRNFTDKIVPDTFVIEKLPYRQLQICVNNTSKIFVKLNIKSYQRILSLFNNYENWPIQVTFAEIASCFKRKELVTLFLYLASLQN